MKKLLIVALILSGCGIGCVNQHGRVVNKFITGDRGGKPCYYISVQTNTGLNDCEVLNWQYYRINVNDTGTYDCQFK